MKYSKKIFACTFFFFIMTSLFAEEIIHVIEQGDTLYAIARKYNVTVVQICNRNNINDSTKIRVGQKLIIPKESEAPSQVSEYIVKKGDTLYAISKKTGSTVAKIKEANNLSSSGFIVVGQKLIIPNGNFSPSDTPSNTSSTSASAKVPPKQTAPFGSKNVDTSLIWPVKAIEMSYVTGKTQGVLLITKQSEKVYSINSGRVTFAGAYRGFGQVIFIQSDFGYVYVYTGLENIKFAKGDSIKYGDFLGTVGVDSISGKPQLNFMVYDDGKPIDPATAPRK